jgi:hypothetical protein
MGIQQESSHTGNMLYWRVNYFQARIAPMTDALVLFFGTCIAHKAKHTQTAVGRSDTHKGQTFEEPHTYVMKRQLNATSKSQASKK